MEIAPGEGATKGSLAYDSEAIADPISPTFKLWHDMAEKEKQVGLQAVARHGGKGEAGRPSPCGTTWRKRRSRYGDHGAFQFRPLHHQQVRLGQICFILISFRLFSPPGENSSQVLHKNDTMRSTALTQTFALKSCSSCTYTTSSAPTESSLMDIDYFQPEVSEQLKAEMAKVAGDQNNANTDTGAVNWDGNRLAYWEWGPVSERCRMSDLRSPCHSVKFVLT